MGEVMRIAARQDIVRHRENMGAGMILDLSNDTRSGPDELSRRTDRSVDALATEAIADFVARELAVVAGIQRGLDDAREGRVTRHADAMRVIRDGARG